MSYDKQIRANITQRLYGDVENIAQREGKSLSQVARQALQLYVDRYSELKTNKRYYQKTFRERIDRMGDIVVTAVLFMAFLMIGIMEHAGFIKERHEGIILIDDALKRVKNGYGPDIRHQIERLSRGSYPQALNVWGDESVDRIRYHDMTHERLKEDSDWLIGDDLPPEAYE